LGQTSAGSPVDRYTLTNSAGMRAKIMTLGATLIGVETPDRRGEFADVTVHLDSLAEYDAGHPCLGSICGRSANRITGGRFTLDGQAYALTPNIPPHHLHGGSVGFDKRVWTARPLEDDGSVGVELTYISHDGEEGYPGTLTVIVRYRLKEDNSLSIDYSAVTDRPTIVNLTNHAYWNLAGCGSALGNVLSIHAEQYLPTNESLIPTGELRAVRGTPMDFTTPHTIGERIAEVDGGYDHCYVLNKKPDELVSLAAHIFDPGSGRTMELFTSEPGVQFYSSNSLDVTRADGHHYGKHDGFCLETQHFPDAPNRPDFPSTVLRPGEVYRQHTLHRFGVLPATS
jgi:aldose 1-epimerase